MKKVGVILPCYNHENFVEQAINSILSQTYKSFDIYAADDASSDGTRDKLLQYDDQIREIHLFDENQGGQTMFLLNRVDNEYTALLNSDDFWHKEKLEKQVHYLEQHPDCAACFTWCNHVNQEGVILSETSVFHQKNKTSPEWIRYFYENGNCLAHPSILIRTDIYKELRSINNNAFRQLPDFYMWIKLLSTYKIHIIEEELISFRWHSSAQSTNVSADTLENSARYTNEECYIWYKTIANMEPELLKSAFGDMLFNQNPRTAEEIKCEKFFLLVRALKEHTRQAAIFYFYDIYTDQKVQNCFKELYSFGRKDFFQLETEIGSAKLFIDDQKLRISMLQKLEQYMGKGE